MIARAGRDDSRRRHRFPAMGAFFAVLLACVCLLNAGDARGDLFSSHDLVSEGTTLTVLPADLDNAGPCEIIVISRTGVYPREKRWISIYAAEHGDRYAPTPRQRWEIDRRACLFDVGDVAPSPGFEIFFLTPDGIHFYAQRTDGRFNTDAQKLLTLPTAVFVPSAGLLPRMQLLANWQGLDRASLLVPQAKSAVLLSRNDSGKWQAGQTLAMTPLAFLYSNQVDDGITRNYALRMDFRLPLPVSEDFDGDGRTDLITTEHESIFVYRQQADGQFTRHPAGPIVLPVRPADMENGPDLSILTTPVDLNGDGFADAMVIVSRGTGKLLERNIELQLFYNRKMPAAPFAAEPDQVLTIRGITPGAFLKDINEDGRKDLLISHIKLGFWNTVRSLVAKETVVLTDVYLLNSAGRYPADPDFELKTTYKLDLSGGIRFLGTWPSMDGDFTGDGRADLLVAHDGSVTVFHSYAGQPLFSTSHTQSELTTCPFRHITDLNRDGRDDIVLYEKKRQGKICVLINTGDWSGTASAGKAGPPHQR